MIDYRQYAGMTTEEIRDNLLKEQKDEDVKKLYLDFFPEYKEINSISSMQAHTFRWESRINPLISTIRETNRNYMNDKMTKLEQQLKQQESANRTNSQNLKRVEKEKKDIQSSLNAEKAKVAKLKQQLKQEESTNRTNNQNLKRVEQERNKKIVEQIQSLQIQLDTTKSKELTESYKRQIQLLRVILK